MRHPQTAAGARPAAYAGILAGLNLYFCHELFRTEFFDNLQSNEGALASLGRFFARHPGARWFPLWNIGMPAENTYSPLAPAAVAALSAAIGISAPLALHIVAGLFFCLAPLTWFWAARKWGVQAECALAGALLYSLLSPTSLLFPVFRSDLAYRTDSRRMMDLVYYGDIAHTIALALLPLALVALERALRTGHARACLVAVGLCAMTALSNAFGITTLALGSLALVASLETHEMRRSSARLALLGVATYLCVCPLLTPRLLALTAHNSQLVGADYRFSILTPLGYAILLGGLATIRVAARRAAFATRFLLGFTWLFGGIPLLYYAFHIVTLPQVLRYHLEIDMGVCLLVALAVWQLPPMPRRAVAALALVLAIPLVIHLRRFDRGLLKPVDFLQTTEYRTSRWIADHLPGVRVMISGDVEFWFNLIADNPQLSAGHEPFAPDFMQRVAVFTIYSGMNAGSRDAEYSIFWLKAFGVAAIHVPGPHSTEYYHPFAHPGKFEGVLPKIWQSGDDAIYAAPLRSSSLAHVIPADAVVAASRFTDSTWPPRRPTFTRWKTRSCLWPRSSGSRPTGRASGRTFRAGRTSRYRSATTPDGKRASTGGSRKCAARWARHDRRRAGPRRTLRASTWNSPAAWSASCAAWPRSPPSSACCCGLYGALWHSGPPRSGCKIRLMSESETNPQEESSIPLPPASFGFPGAFPARAGRNAARPDALRRRGEAPSRISAWRATPST